MGKKPFLAPKHSSCRKLASQSWTVKHVGSPGPGLNWNSKPKPIKATHESIIYPTPHRAEAAVLQPKPPETKHRQIQRASRSWHPSGNPGQAGCLRGQGPSSEAPRAGGARRPELAPLPGLTRKSHRVVWRGKGKGHYHRGLAMTSLWKKSIHEPCYSHAEHIATSLQGIS